MSILPEPSRPFGPIGGSLPDRLNSLVDLSNSLRNIAFGPEFQTIQLPTGLAVNISRGAFVDKVKRTIMAKVTAWVLQDGKDSKWIYTMKAVTPLGGINSFNVFTLTGEEEFQFKAFNLTEANNVALGTGTQGNSIDDSATDFAATSMALVPVGGGSGGVPGNQVVVDCTERRTADGVVLYTFSYENSVDGAC